MNGVSIDGCMFLVLQDVKVIFLGVLYDQLKESGANPKDYMLTDMLVKIVV